jgi:hypothetical protein
VSTFREESEVRWGATMENAFSLALSRPGSAFWSPAIGIRWHWRARNIIDQGGL